MADDASPYAGTLPVAPLSTVGSAVTLVEGRSFCVSGPAGDIRPDSPHGLFVLDTRVLSTWELRLNGHEIEPLAVDADDPFGATFVGRGAPTEGHADADVVVFRHRHVGQGMRERIEVRNYGLATASVVLELTCSTDFADLHAVKESRVDPSVHVNGTVETSALRFGRSHEGLDRQLMITNADNPDISPWGMRWSAEIEPRGTWETCIAVTAEFDDHELEPRFVCGDEQQAEPTKRLARWHAILPRIETNHRPLRDALARSAEDLGALRIFDPEYPDLPILAAGAPWFMTVFGRDSILTAWMTLMADSSLAHGVLHTLARFQGTDEVARTEEQPGKILHEMRFGQAARDALADASVYYGSIDATPLFVALLGELHRWAPDDSLVDLLLPSADHALQWIADFGDRDGDGYVEYQRASQSGLANQGWKDSWDAVRHADGSLATTPIALCEVQGYVYAAYLARADLALACGDESTARTFRAKALDLRTRFNEDFWIDELGCYALGLDADKNPIKVVTSNVGHCLWTGIVDPDRAPLVAAQLMAPQMYSGFGLRTLSANAVAYNPVSYHNGSVWPHDNALGAAGLARYGLVAEAHRIIADQIEVSRRFNGQLPELFTGFGRDEVNVPAPYPTSCSPQAWASASPILWLRTLLRLEPGPGAHSVSLDPALPHGLDRLRVAGIKIGEHSLTVDVQGDVTAVEPTGDLRVLRETPPPVRSLRDEQG